MGVPVEPRCDICGTEKLYRRGVGSYCPNINCGGWETPEMVGRDTPPADGKFVKLTAASVKVVCEENIRKQPMLDKVSALDLFAVLSDGTTRRLTHLMVQVRYPDADRRPGPVRTAFSKMHPDGINLRLVTRDGVDLR